MKAPLLKISAFVGFLLSICISTYAQEIEINLFAGASNYQGDLQDSRYTFEQAHFSFGAGATYRYGRFGGRGMFTYGTISANDKYNKESLQFRNFQFESEVYDLSLLFLFDLLDPAERKLIPYVLGGLAFFHFNPYAYHADGRLLYLRSLHTEGQGLADYPGRDLYSNNQFSIPLGGGVRWQATDFLSVAWEFKFHKSFTDYIDDVSTSYVAYDKLLAAYGQDAVDMAFRADELDPNQVYPRDGDKRGTPELKDWYYFSGIVLSLKPFNMGNQRTTNRRSKQWKCPAVY
jgi:Domain of unknown function (DUF6089)